MAEDEVNDCRVNGKRSLCDLEGRVRLYVLPTLGARKASVIGPAEIRAFIDQRQREGASNGEVNRELSIIKRT